MLLVVVEARRGCGGDVVDAAAAPVALWVHRGLAFMVLVGWCVLAGSLAGLLCVDLRVASFRSSGGEECGC